MGDRIAVLAPLRQAGRSNLMQFGTPEDVYHRPANLFVARFIGSPPMNFFDVNAKDGVLFSQIGPLGLAAKPGFPAEATVGIRPEHVRIGGATGLRIQGILESVENLGHEKLCFFDTPLGRIVARTADMAANPPLGAKMELALRVDDLHMFDRESGSRVDGVLAAA